MAAVPESFQVDRQGPEELIDGDAHGSRRTNTRSRAFCGATIRHAGNKIQLHRLPHVRKARSLTSKAEDTITFEITTEQEMDAKGHGLWSIEAPSPPKPFAPRIRQRQAFTQQLEVLSHDRY